MKINLDNPMLKKALSIASVALAGIVAVANALSDQQKEREFEDMKKAISELQNQMKES